jgi:hypothetical protein
MLWQQRGAKQFTQQILSRPLLGIRDAGVGRHEGVRMSPNQRKVHDQPYGALL